MPRNLTDLQRHWLNVGSLTRQWKSNSLSPALEKAIIIALAVGPDDDALAAGTFAEVWRRWELSEIGRAWRSGAAQEFIDHGLQIWVPRQPQYDRLRSQVNLFSSKSSRRQGSSHKTDTSSAPKSESTDAIVPQLFDVFVKKNADSNAFMDGIQGSYEVFRPGFDFLQEKKAWWVSKYRNQNYLKISRPSPVEAATFEYCTVRKEYTDSWRGYVVARYPYIFLSGLCVDGRDASFLVLKRHPELHDILIGVQSLILPPGHAVSRPVAAISRECAHFEDAISLVETWIDGKRTSSEYLAIDLRDAEKS